VIADTFFYEGDVSFATHKNNNTPFATNNHMNDQSKLESLEQEVSELRSMIPNY